MPRIAPRSCARITERFELQSRVGQPNQSSVRDQPLPIGGNEVCHRAIQPDMAMKPKPAIDCMHHPIAAPTELAPLCRIPLLFQNSSPAY